MKLEKVATIIGVVSVIVAAIWAVATRTIDSETRTLEVKLVSLKNKIDDLENKTVALEPNITILPPETNSYEGAYENEHSVVFLTPKDGETVKGYIDVSYSVEGDIPSGYHVILVVQDPIGQYWSWGKVTAELPKRIQVGVEKDEGKGFNILLLVTNLTFPISQPRYDLPNHISVSRIHVVRNR